MTSQALADYVHVSKYANYVPELRRRETKRESGQRMFDMHRSRYSQSPSPVHDAIDEAQAAFDADLILGSQRALQFGGHPILRKNARGFNCTASYCDRPRFFQEALWLLLCGCGVGFSVQRHHVARLPTISRPKGNGSTRTHVIADTIEGWSDALGHLMRSYFDDDGTAIAFDYGLVRKEGSPLSSSNGKAPGPGPLRRALEKTRALLERCLEHGQDRLRPIDAYDVVMHASDAVLAGGVRRSSAICIFSADDRDMAMAKTGDWYRTNPQRGRSNNSALLVRGKTDRATFDWLMGCARHCGEPGFFWADSTEIVPNPCGEVGFMPVFHALTGWGFCNLSTINMELVRTRAQALRAARAAAIVGTLQAGYTDFEYLGATSENIARAEALLGVSMTGLMRNPDMAFDPQLLRDMAREVLTVNKWLSALIGIAPAARATCLKPEGTGSLTLQTSSGMTADHARRYLRNVQANVNEAPLIHFESINPLAVEHCHHDPNAKTRLISFCVEAPKAALVKSDITALDMLARVKLIKENWVDEGKRESRCLHPSLSHNVSNTINVQPGEWEAAGDYIFDNQHTFAGITLLGTGADLDFLQPAYQEVKTSEGIAKAYGDNAFAAGIMLTAIPFRDLWQACDSIIDCELGHGVDEVVLTIGQRAWISNARLQAHENFQGDEHRLIHCLKDLYLLNRWRRLVDGYKPVDYKLMVEDDDDTSFETEAACAGGVCELV